MIVVDEKNYEYKKWKGGSSFPLNSGVCDIMKCCNHSFECHWHDGIEIIWIVEGEMMHIVNGNSYLMQKGDFMFVNSGSMHEGHATACECGKYMVISFLPSVICSEDKGRVAEKYFGEVMSGTNFPSLFLKADDENAVELCRLCTEISTLNKNKEQCYELNIKAALCKIWAILFAEASKSEKETCLDVSISRMKKAVSYIDKNYQKKISLEEIAEACNISKSELCRSFKRIMHRTPFDYIVDLRVRKSIELLDEGKGVTEAAFASGFFDSSYYTKMFKRYMSCTPREYLKEKIR